MDNLTAICSDVDVILF